MKDLPEIRQAKERILLAKRIEGPLIAEKFYGKRSPPVIWEADRLVVAIILMREDKSRESQIEIPPFYYGEQTRPQTSTRLSAPT